MTQNYDPKCYEIAEYFMEDCAGSTEARICELAARIQQTIEDYAEELINDELAAYDAAVERALDLQRETGERQVCPKRRIA